MWQETGSQANMYMHIEQAATHIFVGGLVEGDQVSVEASKSHYRPECEEAHQHLHHSREDS